MRWPFFAPKNDGITTEHVIKQIERGAKTSLDERAFLEKEIQKYLNSPIYHDICKAVDYYEGRQDILKHQRTVIGKDGSPIVVKNLPNERIIDNQYAKAVSQKQNYLCGKPFTMTSENDDYIKAVKPYFSRKFMRTYNSCVLDSVNTSIGYLHPYYDPEGKLRFKHFRTWEILPFWKDEEHTELDAFARIYQVQGYTGSTDKTWTLVDYYTLSGVKHYVYDGDVLIPDVEHPDSSHFEAVIMDGDREERRAANWKRIPLVAFKRNSTELPLLNRCKSLQDGINTIVSNFMNNMLEDARNTILILVNYDGENIADFRQNLAQYGVVKVTTIDGQAGDLKKLQVEVNSQNYNAILEILKEALIENCRSYNVKDARLNGDANQMHIQSAFADVDLEADDMEIEYQAAFEDLLWFVNVDLKRTGKGDFFDEELSITFNRNMLINEQELINNCVSSKGIISDETIRAKHPWCVSPLKEKRLLEEEQKAMEANLYDPFGQAGGNATPTQQPKAKEGAAE